MNTTTIRGEGAILEQTDPAWYVRIDMARHVWDLAEPMDGTAEPNAHILAAAPVDESPVIVRWRPGSGSWAHVRIRDVNIDLDKTPILSFKLRDLGRGTADSTAVKLLDHETQRMVLLGEFYSRFYQDRAFDLRERLEVTGERSLDLSSTIWEMLQESLKRHRRATTSCYRFSALKRNDMFSAVVHSRRSKQPLDSSHTATRIGTIGVERRLRKHGRE